MLCSCYTVYHTPHTPHATHHAAHSTARLAVWDPRTAGHRTTRIGETADHSTTDDATLEIHQPAALRLMPS